MIDRQAIEKVEQLVAEALSRELFESEAALIAGVQQWLRLHHEVVDLPVHADTGGLNPAAGQATPVEQTAEPGVQDAAGKFQAELMRNQDA